MSLLSTFEAFLRQPTTTVLADGATLSYVPTLTTLTEPAAITRHLQAQGKQLAKKSERVLDVVEGNGGLHVDVETTLEFMTAGGAYLPGLDDNFLADKIVTLPLAYTVRFDEAHKILNIRVTWDQGSLLKQLEVIGARGRNWPIRDGKEQAKLIASQSSIPAKEQAAAGISTRRSTNATTNSDRSGGSSVSATGDPHASLNLFAPRAVEEDDSAYVRPAGDIVSPRTSARPPARDLDDILTGNYDPASPTSPASGAGSPSKRNTADRNHARIGASKHFQPMRLFDQEETPRAIASPAKSSKKFNHFEFGNGEDAPAAPVAPVPADKLKQEVDDGLAKKKMANANKHASQWDFEDFVTPDVRAAKVGKQHQRTYDWSDEAAEEEEAGQSSPIFRPVVHRPRPDAQSQFEIVDETPIADRQAKVSAAGMKGRQHNAGLQLYKDHILGDDDINDDAAKEGDDKTSQAKKPLAPVTNINNARRGKDFGSQWEARDESPSVQRTSGNVNDDSGKENGNGVKKPILTAEGKKVLKGMDASWALYDESPGAETRVNERKPLGGVAGTEGRGIKTAGNGMGGRNTVRHWGFGFDEEDEAEGKATQGQKKVGAAAAGGEKSFWDF